MAKSKPLHIPSLDGLRAVSFFIVFVGHSGEKGFFPGAFGVTVFFFLSGFLITTLMRIEDESTGTVSLRDFYLRRVFRILPPFYLTLVVVTTLVLLRFSPGFIEFSPTAALALHYGNYWMIGHGGDGMAPGAGVYWSLAVEEHFYLLFPLLYLITRRAGLRGISQGMVFLLFCGAILAWRLYLVLHLGVIEDRTYMGSDTRFDSILYGCALAVAMNPVLDPPRGRDRIWKWVLLPAATAVLVFCFAYRAPWFRETIRYSLQGSALVAIFVSAMRFPEWGPFRILNNKVVAFLGVLTYTLYLVHQCALYTVRYHFPALHPALRALIALAASITFAVAMYNWVERPFGRLRRRFSNA